MCRGISSGHPLACDPCRFNFTFIRYIDLNFRSLNLGMLFVLYRTNLLFSIYVMYAEGLAAGTLRHDDRYTTIFLFISAIVNGVPKDLR